MLLTYVRITSPKAGRVIAATQIIFDIGLMSAAVYINRGIESPLAMFYAIPIVMTAAFFSRRAIYTTGVAVAVIYTTLALLDFTGILPALHIAAPQLHTNPQLVFPPLVAVVTIILSITAVTDLVGRLIREREQLMLDMEALSAHNAQTEAILQTLGSGLVVVDVDCTIRLSNHAFEGLTGWKRAEVIGKQLDDVLPILDAKGNRVQAAHRPMLQFISDNKLAAFDKVRALSGFSYMRKDGTSFPFVGNVSPIISSGKAIGFTTIFDDATESKKIDQLKDNFIALISHQLKTPLGEINGFAYNLLGNIAGKMTKKQTDYVLQIQEQAARAGKLIADLLDIALATGGGLSVHNTPIDVGPVITEAIKLRETYAHQKGLRLEAKLPDKLVYVRGESHKLVQALSNLMDNAIRYSKSGTIVLSVVVGEKVVEIYVRDHGKGMDQATMDLLFGDRVTGGPLGHAPTAEGGTGLGVYLAKQLVSLMGGKIHVVSSSKRGTTICVTMQRVK